MQLQARAVHRRARGARAAPYAALLPLALLVGVGYLGSVVWTLRISFSSSRTFPAHDWVGWAQYERLFGNERWLLSLQNLAAYGLGYVALSLLLGLLLAIAIDQKVRAEGALRTVFLYPYAMSFVATGLVWQWMLNPVSGLQSELQRWGIEAVTLDWIVRDDRVIWALVLATVWQSAGMVMALLLAGLRGVDEGLWKAARMDGIPRWRTYVSIVLPTLGPSFATAGLLLATAAVKVFDAVAAMTQGGPGTASEVPAKFIMDHLFGRANIAQASAAAMVLLLTAVALAAPLLYARSRRRAQSGS